jgi:GNAT superfamily N-acetyltransferase
MRVVPFGPEHGPGFGALFDGASSGCHCRYWHFTGTKNDWLARAATEPEANLAEQLAAAHAGDASAKGLVALADDAGAALVGWLKLAPRAALPKLRALPVYKGLDLGPHPADRVYVVGCLLVHPEHRRRGVARALVEAAPAFVRAWGGAAIEAYPRRTREPLHDEEAWMGPESIYARAGYREVAGEGPYPVLRLELEVRP